jgi:anti-sigma factor RsiW
MDAQPVVCRELVELATEYLDGALPPDRHAAVTRHLDGCDGCVEYVRQLLFPARLRCGTDRQ